MMTPSHYERSVRLTKVCWLILRSCRISFRFSLIASWCFSALTLGIVNRGDSFRRRRSRSASLIPSSPMKAADDGLSNSGPSDSYLVAMLGAAGVGKCALLSQFRTSECINAYETGRGESTKKKLPLLLLESQLENTKFLLCLNGKVCKVYQKPGNYKFFLRFHSQNKPLQSVEVLRVPINSDANWIFWLNASRRNLVGKKLRRENVK